jgi:hypothetical protein
MNLWGLKRENWIITLWLILGIVAFAAFLYFAPFWLIVFAFGCLIGSAIEKSIIS